MWILNKTVLVLAGLLVVAPLGSQDYTTYPLSITNHGAYDMVADDLGNLHLLWSSGKILYYARIVKNGSSYQITGQQTIVNSAYSIDTQYSMPRIAVKADGSEIHTAWGNGNYELWHAWRDSSGIWHTEKIGNRTDVSEGYYRYLTPMCAVRSDGSVHVIYQWWNSFYNFPIHIKYIYKSGSTWSSPVTVSVRNDVEEHRDCTIFVDKDDGLHATWRGLPGNVLPEYRVAAAGARLDQGSVYYIPTRPQVSYNGMGDIYVDNSGTVYRTISTWVPSMKIVTVDLSIKPVWSDFLILTNPSQGSTGDDQDHWAAVTTDSRGYIYVAFYEEFDQTNQHSRSRSGTAAAGTSS